MSKRIVLTLEDKVKALWAFQSRLQLFPSLKLHSNIIYGAGFSYTPHSPGVLCWIIQQDPLPKDAEEMPGEYGPVYSASPAAIGWWFLEPPGMGGGMGILGNLSPNYFESESGDQCVLGSPRGRVEMKRIEYGCRRLYCTTRWNSMT